MVGAGACDPDGWFAGAISAPTLECFPPTGTPAGTAVIIGAGCTWTVLMVDKEGVLHDH